MKDAPEITKQSYNKIAKIYAKENFDYKPTESLLREFLSFLPKNSSILDVGCGPGRDVKYFIDHGMNGTGADYSFGMIREARKKVPEGKFVKTDMRHLKFKDNVFDGLWSMSGINFLPKSETQKVLKEFRRVLKAGGILFISVPEGKKKRFFELYDKPVFSVSFKLNELKNLLKKLEFKVIETKADVATKGRAKGGKFVTVFAEVKK